MKIAYFGIDALANCLEHLVQGEHKIVKIFTTPGDEYDATASVCKIAKTNNIPIKQSRVTIEDITELEQEGVTLTITAGYPYKIPTTDGFMQINIHPAFLPEGRGPWPMPVAIMQGRPSGVTIHKLAEGFDEGDIILQEQIPLDEQENLITLQAKIAKTAEKLLKEFLSSPKTYWDLAKKQTNGEYWQEPSDLDRTLNTADTPELKQKKLRAFAGYGCLTYLSGIPWVTNDDGSLNKMYFRPIKLSDRADIERIRKSHSPQLSDYTFALLWCWRKLLKLQVCLGENFYAVKSDDYYFFPIGPHKTANYYLKELAKTGATLRFCDEASKDFVLENFPNSQILLSEEDSDYVIENQSLHELAGGQFLKRRNDLHHFMSLTPPPVVEPITKENIKEVKQISDQFILAGSSDGDAESEAIKNFFELGLKGVLVKRDAPVAFAICSEKDENTIQGHFSKCLDRTRGASLFTIRACSDQFENYKYTNLEDDMGIDGLRIFKRSLKAQTLPSYTITLKK